LPDNITPTITKGGIFGKQSFQTTILMKLWMLQG